MVRISLFYPCFLDFFLSGAETGVFGVAVLELGAAVGLALAGAYWVIEVHIGEAKKLGRDPAWSRMGGRRMRAP
jgi:hypothetical protein